MDTEANQQAAETAKKRRRTDIANWLSLGAGVLTTVVGVRVWSESNLQKREVLRQTIAISEDEFKESIEKQSAITNEVASQVKELQKHLASLSNVPKEDALNIAIQKLGASIDDLNSRESRLESVIMQNPAKALEVPLLRRDLDSQKDAQQTAFSALKDSVDRIYDLNKWLLGAMAISIVTLAVGNLLRPKEPKP